MWENDEIKNLRPENLFAVETATGYSAKWIGTGKGVEKLNQLQAPQQAITVPIIDWDHAADETPQKAPSSQSVSDANLTTLDHQNAFALIVQDDLLAANSGLSIPCGATIIVCPNESPEKTPSRLGLFHIKQTNEIICRKLTMAGKKRIITPLNPDFQKFETRELAPEDAIIGAITSALIHT